MQLLNFFGSNKIGFERMPSSVNYLDLNLLVHTSK
jgi:hypothetical protein